MAVFILVIQVVFFSLAMAEQELTTDLDGWWYLVKPVQLSPLPSSTSGPLSSELPVRRNDYTYEAGIGGYKIHTQANTWNEARKICKKEGGHLAVINSVAESNFITTLFKTTKPAVGSTGDQNLAFIGFHDLFKEGEFVTIHGEPLEEAGYTSWQAGDPNNLNGIENCGTLVRRGVLNDAYCETKLAFICELPIA